MPAEALHGLTLHSPTDDDTTDKNRKALAEAANEQSGSVPKDPTDARPTN